MADTRSTDRFSGQVALVSGAGSGIGRATALRLAREGAMVMGVDIDDDGLARTAESAVGLPGEVATGRCDVTSRDECHSAVSATVERFGALDHLANVAGIARAHHVTDVTQQEWDLIMAVNVGGVFWLSQAAIPHLLERSGSIVNVASNAGLMGQAYTVPYCTSKGAVVQLTRSIAMEYVKTGLRVNCVCPGGVATALAENFQTPADVDFELMAPYMGHRGMAEADDAADAIVWLMSAEARRCHGTILSVDAGLTAG